MVIGLKVYFCDRHIKKRIMCLLLAILVSFTVIMVQVQEAHAFVPLIIAGVEIAPEVIAGGLTLLAAAGITFASSTDAQNAFTQMWVQGGENLQNNLNTLGTGIVNVSDSLWQSVTGWINGKFYPGANVASTGIAWVTDNGIQYPYTIYSPDVGAAVAPIDSITWQSNTYSKVKLTDDATADIWTIQYNGADAWWSLHIQVKHGTAVTMCLLAISNQGLVPFLYYRDINGTLTRTQFNILPSSWNQELQNYVTGTTATPNYNYTGEDIVSTPNYDFKTAEGVRKVSVTSNPDDVIGKTSTQVQNPVVAIPSYSDSWSGTFRQSATTGDYTFTGTGTYTGTMDIATTGTWEGEWTTTTTGQRVWTGTYTAADATTWTGTATETLPANPTAENDYPRWKIPADTLKNKFPFSIPWDLKNAVTSLVATPEAPHWTVTFPSNVFVGGGSFEIDFIQFETWAKIVRWGILIAFNIFLILATRKIIGAS